MALSRPTRAAIVLLLALNGTLQLFPLTPLYTSTVRAWDEDLIGNPYWHSMKTLTALVLVLAALVPRQVGSARGRWGASCSVSPGLSINIEQALRARGRQLC